VVDLGLTPEFNFAGSFSISLWANMSAWGDSWGNCMVANRGEQGMGWQLRRHSGNQNLTFTIRGTSGADDPQGSIVPALDEWHHIAAVYNADAAAGERRVYINGERDAFIIDSGAPAPAEHNVFIGCRATQANDGTERLFNGMLDEIRIYTKPLTEGEVRFLGQ
jgi:hypothetical protein